MVQLDAELRARGLGAAMVLQVHDELVLEVPDEEFDEVATLTRHIMEQVIELRVPLKVEIGSGKTLADTK